MKCHNAAFASEWLTCVDSYTMLGVEASEIAVLQNVRHEGALMVTDNSPVNLVEYIGRYEVDAEKPASKKKGCEEKKSDKELKE